MLVAERLCKRYGAKLALDGLSFYIEKGHVMGFIGPNGAGKSTTMRILCGAMPPSSGTVRIDGMDMSENPLEAKSSIGYLPENAPLYANMTVRSFLSFCGAMRGLAGAALSSRLGAAFEMCALHEVEDEEIDSLSKGYRRRVCLAQAVLHDPQILILDEPTDGLDPNQKREIRRLIASMRSEKAIIVSTHVLEELEAVCNRVLAIARGRKLFDGGSAEFKALSPDDGAVELSISGADDAQSALAAFSGTPGAAGAEPLSPSYGVSSLGFKIKPGALRAEALLSEAFRLAASQGWKVEGCKVAEGRLDEIFHRLTDGAGGGGA